MASLTRRPNGQWRARYRDPAGREHAKHFSRKIDAQRWLDEATASLVTGQYVAPDAGRVTVAEYAEAWRAGQVHRPSTRAHVETMLRRHVYPTFGDRPVASVRPSEVQAWVTGLAGHLSPATVAVAHGLLSSVFRAAVRDRRVAANPCEGTKLPRTHRAPVDPLPTEAVLALADAVPPYWRALVVLLAGTGLRQGEALGLTRDRVDFLRRQLLVDRQAVTVPGRAPFLGPPKTRASVRTVPLPGSVVDVLAAHVAAYGVPADGLLWADGDGSPMRRTAFSAQVWRPAVTRAGLPAGTRCHDLRHFYASLLIRHGESVKTVQARLGHATAAETLDTYSHLWPDSDDRTRDAVDSVIGSVADCVRTAEGGDARFRRSGAG